MESLIGLVNRIQRACTVLGDYGGDSALPTLWEALPSVAVVGGQVLFFKFLSFCFAVYRFEVNLVWFCQVFGNECRVLESRRCWRALSDEIFFLEDQVVISFEFWFPLFLYCCILFGWWENWRDGKGKCFLVFSYLNNDSFWSI